MTVTFVHCTPDAEHLIVDMARVSNPDNQGNYETGPKLLRYLIKHKHWSPFEMASLCVKIDTERDISAQILRHRSFSFQEYSTRYAEANYPGNFRLRTQDVKNRQNSFDNLNAKIEEDHSRSNQYTLEIIYNRYQQMLDAGIAKETARRILPLCSPTTLYMHGTIRSWIHYLEIRCLIETQLEHRLIANQCKEIFTEKFPVIAQAIFTSEQ